MSDKIAEMLDRAQANHLLTKMHCEDLRAELAAQVDKLLDDMIEFAFQDGHAVAYKKLRPLLRSLILGEKA